MPIANSCADENLVFVKYCFTVFWLVSSAESKFWTKKNLSILERFLSFWDDVLNGIRKVGRLFFSP